MKIDRILFPTDFSECSNLALGHALLLAKFHGAQLHILHNVEWKDRGPTAHLPDPETILKKLEEVSRVKLDNITSGEPSQIEIVKRTFVNQSTTKVILDYITTRDIKLAVLGTRGRAGISNFFLGSVTEEVIRKATCPVIAVRDLPHKDMPLKKIEHVLVAIDVSQQSEAVLSQAAEMAAAHNAQLSVLHVVPNYFASNELGKNLMAQLVAERRGQATALVEGLGLSANLICEVSLNHPAKAIVEIAADRDVDMIAIGTHGFGGINRFLLGSTAERVIRTATCPVYAINYGGDPDPQTN